MLTQNVIFSLRESDIIFASKTARRAISLGVSRISLRSNTTRRKANITEKDDCFRNRLFLGGGWWIRTTEGIASRFTVCPLWPLGKSPIFSSVRPLEPVDGLVQSRCGSQKLADNSPPDCCIELFESEQFLAPFGAGRRTRTPDLLITNQLLYQLSYTGGSNRTCLL